MDRVQTDDFQWLSLPHSILKGAIDPKVSVHVPWLPTHRSARITYPDEYPVSKVVDGAEEPELVQEQIGARHHTLVWNTQGEKAHSR